MLISLYRPKKLHISFIFGFEILFNIQGEVCIHMFLSGFCKQYTCMSLCFGDS